MLKLKSRAKIAFVPTMGFLHDGHLSLIRLAKKKADVVVVSIFVNPKQFDQKQDLKNYPTNQKQDLKSLKNLDVDYVFLPNAKDMYSPDFQTQVSLSELTQSLCGKTRPGHFEGVATVVLKLLQIVQPDIAIFGKKDYQQLLVIQQMVKDLNVPVKIIGAPLRREKDGLAMSSRNSRIKTSQREATLSLWQGLQKAKALSQTSSASIQKLVKVVRDQMAKHPQVRIDYIECRHAQTLKALKSYEKSKTLLAVAAFVGDVRLIDNIVL